MMEFVKKWQGWLLASTLSGGLLFCAFPTLQWDLLAWIALVPLFCVMRQRPFGSGFVAGLAFYLPTLSWLNIVMTRYGGLPLATAFPLQALLACYLALYFGGSTWLACRLERRFSFSFGLTLPFIWIAFDWVRSFLLTGFPWASLGYSLDNRLTLIQSADHFGVYGMTFLLILGNAAFASLLISCVKAAPFGGSLKLTLVFGLLFLINWGYGHQALNRSYNQGDPLRVAAIQGNIAQDVKWDPAYLQSTVDTYVDLSREAAEQKTLDLIVWPEAAMPFYYQDPGPLRRAVQGVPQQTNAYLLFGAPGYRRTEAGTRYLNSAYLLNRKGDDLGRSDKAHLVPFGEYVPLASLLTFVDKLVVGVGNFSPGTVTPLPLDKTSMGVLVCYEVIFPALARRFVSRGAGMLVNITNDAWFGRSAAPRQHLAMARFRAIENRVPMVRAANTGISAIILPTGEMRSVSGLFQPAVARAEISPNHQGSFYGAWGYYFPHACFILVLVLSLLSLRTPSFPVLL